MILQTILKMRMDCRKYKGRLCKNSIDDGLVIQGSGPGEEMKQSIRGFSL
jgi:hypothetical protein